jgi:hypothetical protein
MSCLDSIMALGDLNLVSKFKDRSREIFWTIEEFPVFMQNFSQAIVSDQLTVLLPCQSEPTVFTIKCLPREWQNGQLCVKLVLQLEKELDSLISVELCQLGTWRADVAWKLTPSDSDKSIYESFTSHDELEELHDDRLIIYFRLTVDLNTPGLVSTTARPGQQKQDGQQPTENIYKDMLDPFVDVGGSVLLVFEDGELQCHPFPLAARYNVLH